MNQSNDPSQPRVAIISASWHAEIVHQARDSIIAELGDSIHTETVSVPGAYEIPLHAKLLAKSGRFDAIVACGLVVDGGIYRHDFVATAVIDGLMQVQLETEVPVFSVVLTPHQFHEHATHLHFFHEHFVHKGKEAAAAVRQTLESLRAIKG